MGNARGKHWGKEGEKKQARSYKGVGGAGERGVE
jgi:hypothetical protein